MKPKVKAAPKAKMKKVKEETVSSLIKKLDTVFSLYVRLSNSDENGLCKCCTCGVVKPYKEQQCGHFISRSIKALRWMEENTGVQCVSCNIFKQGEQYKFSLYLKEKYGEQVIDLLETKRNNKFKPERFLLRFQIQDYAVKVKQLKKNLK